MLKREARVILGFPPESNPSTKDIRKAYRTLALLNHPDRGGDHLRMVEINTAFDILLGKRQEDRRRPQEAQRRPQEAQRKPTQEQEERAAAERKVADRRKAAAAQEAAKPKPDEHREGRMCSFCQQKQFCVDCDLCFGCSRTTGWSRWSPRW